MQEEEQDEQMKRRQELIESKRHPNIKDDSDDFVHLINLSGSLPLEYAEFDEAMGIAEISLSERNVQVSDDFDDQPYDDRLQAGNLITQRIYAQP